jgi:thymidylate synthase (FAD)
MKIIEPYHVIETPINGEEILKHIELVGRVCYKSEDKITEESAKKFVADLIKRGHEAVIEHYNITVRFVCDRGVSHEIVRHRIASYAQESTRYVNYSKDKFGNELTFILPCFWDEEGVDDDRYDLWKQTCLLAEKNYLKLIKIGATPQEARSVLPNSLKTEIMVTMNLRELRHFLKLRTAKAAHPQMKEITIPLLAELKEKLPVIFDDIIVED